MPLPFATKSSKACLAAFGQLQLRGVVEHNGVVLRQVGRVEDAVIVAEVGGVSAGLAAHHRERMIATGDALAVEEALATPEDQDAPRLLGLGGGRCGNRGLNLLKRWRGESRRRFSAALCPDAAGGAGQRYGDEEGQTGAEDCVVCVHEDLTSLRFGLLPAQYIGRFRVPEAGSAVPGHARPDLRPFLPASL